MVANPRGTGEQRGGLGPCQGVPKLGKTGSWPNLGVPYLKGQKWRPRLCPLESQCRGPKATEPCPWGLPENPSQGAFWGPLIRALIPSMKAPTS